MFAHARHPWRYIFTTALLAVVAALYSAGYVGLSTATYPFRAIGGLFR